MADEDQFRERENLSEDLKQQFEQPKPQQNTTFGNNTSEPGDPCYSYEYSVIFCLIMATAIVTWVILFSSIIYKKKLNLSGLERIYLFLGICGIVQFGPLLASAIHYGHGIFSYTQTSCKLMFYTEYGTRHTVTFLVLTAYTYAHLGLRHGFESVDRKLKENTGWFVVLLLAIECLFGIGPAAYVDVFPIYVFPEKMHSNGLKSLNKMCIWTLTMDVSQKEAMPMELVERAWTPYIIPCIGLAATEIVLSLFSASLVNLTSGVTEPKRKSRLRLILICVISYFSMNLPYSFVILVKYYSLIYKLGANTTVICNLQWFSVLIHQLWFVVTPACMLIMENLLPDSVASTGAHLTNKIKTKLSQAISKSKGGGATLYPNEQINQLPSIQQNPRQDIV